MIYLGRLQVRALEEYRLERLEWALLAPHSKEKTSPPDPPDILKLKG